jgi:hypothetical protein
MFDQYGYIYILDDANSRIQKWFPGSTFGTTILSATFNDPLGMELDQFGNLYVADANYHRIQQFAVYCRKFIYIIQIVIFIFIFI